MIGIPSSAGTQWKFLDRLRKQPTENMRFFNVIKTFYEFIGTSGGGGSVLYYLYLTN